MAVSNLPLVGRWTSGRVNGGWRLVIGESGTRETTRESYSGRQRPDDWVPHAIATPYVLVAQLFSQHRGNSRRDATFRIETSVKFASAKRADGLHRIRAPAGAFAPVDESGFNQILFDQRRK